MKRKKQEEDGEFDFFLFFSFTNCFSEGELGDRLVHLLDLHDDEVLMGLRVSPQGVWEHPKLELEPEGALQGLE